MAQLGARLDGIEEVVGSNPIGSTNGRNQRTYLHKPLTVSHYCCQLCMPRPIICEEETGIRYSSEFEADGAESIRLDLSYQGLCQSKPSYGRGTATVARWQALSERLSTA